MLITKKRTQVGSGKRISVTVDAEVCMITLSTPTAKADLYFIQLITNNKQME
jgi:hypothetical protein